MKLGLDIADFTWPAGPAKLGSAIADIARTADQAGFDSIWVMDHFWQIRMNGPEHHEMLEGYSALSFVAGLTSRAKLGTMVTGAVYHHPGILAKTVTTLDVLSGGRAWLGIGGGGEKKTLRLVAQYADACNLLPSPEIPRKLDILREHCQAVGRNYDDIEKTSLFQFDVGENGENVGKVIGGLQWLASMGIQTVIGGVPHVDRIKPLEIIGEKLIPAVANLEPAAAASR